MRYEADKIASNIEKKGKITKVATIIFIILLIPILFLSYFLITLEVNGTNAESNFFNINVYMVTSESMEPKLKKNDIIIVKKGYNNEKFKIGNIISYIRSDGEIITHRINDVVTSMNGERAYITKGDNNALQDEEIVEYNAIIGKVIYTMPRLGKFINLLKNKLFFGAVLVTLILVVLYDIRITKRKKERKIIREKYEKKSDFYF